MCEIAQTVSSPAVITCGVAQGSNLGPLLFLITLKSLIFCFRREMQFALAHRRLRVQRLSQNAIGSNAIDSLTA